MAGNNSQLVRRVMQTTGRSAYWQELTSQTSSHFHFRWAPVSKQVNYERLSFNNFFAQITNHVEGHAELSRKHDLFKNMKAYCSSCSTNDSGYQYNDSVFHITPMTFYVKVQPEKGTYLSIKQ